MTGDTIPHGTNKGYQGHKCRCEPCKIARRDYVRHLRSGRDPRELIARRKASHQFGGVELGAVDAATVHRAQVTVAALLPREAVAEVLDMLGINHPVVTP